MTTCFNLKGKPMSSYEEHSRVLTFEEFEREHSNTEKGAAELVTVSDADEADSHNSKSGGSPPAGLLWGDFKRQNFPVAELIVFGIRRGNVGLLVAETNVGKTTLALNVGLTLAADRTFLPIVEMQRGGLRVMYIDGESARAELQEDVLRMLHNWPFTERNLVDRNLLLLCDEEFDGEALDLANARHREIVRRAAREFKPDLIVVDTLAALFNLENENDNAEIKKRVMSPLKSLAKEVNAAVLLTHHIGKPRSEEGNIRSHAYSGRGASNFGGLARSVAVLNAPDRSDKGHVVLSMQKAKGYRLKDVTLHLADKSRWFTVTGETPLEAPSCLNDVVTFVTRPTRTSEIVDALKGKHKKRTVEDALRKAVERGKLKASGRGWYEPLETTATTLPYGDRGNVDSSELNAA
jgi:AAA domain-containing protein